MANHHQGVEEFSLQDQTWRGVTVTMAAAERIFALSQAGLVVRFSVKTSGCTGYAYVIKQLEKPQASDVLFESNGCVFYVELKALPIFDGTEIDFVRQGLNQSFIYRNPNVKTECGCGESFGI
ncbi:iron-sulfur cluster assembly accessory protein [Photobacterium phosphoreum]|uniref:iron-sulfur cluster assembly accessory protein n=1 Tax=Photobacterium phosphoreum TaxID=659 RepID=UPI000D151456|nr:iron-sulfur cluster assembly accessory protein [Photobacterium phosphoreum]PSU69770.1 iron-sulfur cluster assembly accessory protein [Photobacterium phosphoreum]PSU74902.1 iron-sulfur cluster assembly accessory protein [Photobacterium phosphoreum]